MPSEILTAKELRAKRAKIWDDAQKVLETARKEERDLTDEERTNFDTAHTDMEALGEDIDRLEAHEELGRDLEKSRGTRAGKKQGEDERDIDAPKETASQKQTRAVRAWLAEAAEEVEVAEADVEAAREVGILGRRTIPLKLLSNRELRALSLAATEGGETVPEGFAGFMERAMLAFGGMRRASTTILRTSKGNDLPFPTVDDTGNTGALLDINTEDAEEDIVTGSMILGAYKYTSRIIRVPIELLQDEDVALEDFIGTALGERIGRITNTHFTVGTGVDQPNGAATAATLGKTGAAGQVATVIYDDLIDLQHSVDEAYRQMGAQFMFSDLTLAELKKLVDDQNRPLWQPGLATREPNVLLGDGYVVNNDVADMAASARSILYGAFQKFYVRDVMDVMLKRLDERYTEFHQVGFVAISRHDADLLDAGTNPIKFYANAAA